MHVRLWQIFNFISVSQLTSIKKNSSNHVHQRFPDPHFIKTVILADLIEKWGMHNLQIIKHYKVSNRSLLNRAIYQQNNNGRRKAVAEENTQHSYAKLKGSRNKLAAHMFRTSDLLDTGCTNPSHNHVN